MSWQCESCGLGLHMSVLLDDEEMRIEYFSCPNYESAFMEYISGSDYLDQEPLGTYPCERVYEIPLYYHVIQTD